MSDNSLKIAILVLAHKAPEVLQYQIEALRHPQIHHFVHLDPKADPEKFDFLKDTNIQCVSAPHNIFWGGFSMVEAEISLLRLANDNGYDRFVLVSDDSFPLMRASDLIKSLEPPLNWAGRLKSSTDWPLQRYADFFFYDSHGTNPRSHAGSLGKFDAREASTFLDLANLMVTGKRPIPRFYHGSQWWVLTKPAADRVLNVFDDDLYLKMSFRFSAIPDESYIQTIVGNAFPREMGERTLMWTDFSRQIRPHIFTDVRDLSGAFESGYPFVRKIEGDMRLLEHLSHRLL